MIRMNFAHHSYGTSNLLYHNFLQIFIISIVKILAWNVSSSPSFSRSCSKFNIGLLQTFPVVSVLCSLHPIIHFKSSVQLVGGLIVVLLSSKSLIVIRVNNMNNHLHFVMITLCRPSAIFIFSLMKTIENVSVSLILSLPSLCLQKLRR